MATTSRRKSISQATSSVQGRQAERARPTATRQPAAPAAAPSRVGPRSQAQGGPKLNELRGKIAKLEKDRAVVRDQALQEVAEIEEILGQLTMTAFSVVATATRVAEIRTHCDALRKVLA